MQRKLNWEVGVQKGKKETKGRDVTETKRREHFLEVGGN